MELSDELLQASEDSKSIATEIRTSSSWIFVDKLLTALNNIRMSFSGSWLGYHSTVYYQNFEIPPAGARFSQEWGLMDTIGSSYGSRGNWEEYTIEEVRDHMLRDAGLDASILSELTVGKQYRKRLEDAIAEGKSVFSTQLKTEKDSYLEELQTELSQVSDFIYISHAQRVVPKGQVVSRDSEAALAGNRIPLHYLVAREALEISDTVEAAERTSSILEKAGTHIQRVSHKKRDQNSVGTRIFIGHGNSHVWRDLKDFLTARLGLEWDEFNRVPVAGITNISRLQQMLENAAFAFLVMTAEDETQDGKLNARMNVVHEAGLFQGKLGFNRAIVLLEEGCEEFSNIQGLGQIRFPMGNIEAKFEDIRLVLEREDLIQ